MMILIIKRLFKSVGVGYIYSRDINISKNEFLKLKSFSENYNNEYNILNNTCVNFVWNALEYAGLNPKGFKGDNIPINNINNFEILAEALNSNKREEQLLKIDYDSNKMLDNLKEF